MKKWILALSLLPMVAFAAPAKNAPRSKTLKPIAKTDLRGLSIFGSFDMTDSFDFSSNSNNQSTSGTFGTEKAFGFGAEYLITQLDNGVGLQAGGSFEMGRVVSNAKSQAGTLTYEGAKPEVQFWTVYGQGAAMLTEEIGVFGGVNYAIPQIKNIPGGTWKSGFGYQIGATYMVNENMAVDGLYRTLNISGSAKAQDGATVNYDNIRNQGFTFRGRYLF